MYAPPAAYREHDRARARTARAARSRPGTSPILDGDGVGAFLDTSSAASDRLAAARRRRRSTRRRATLLELCARVHAAYGGLPEERVADLALTVDGHLAELVAAGQRDVASGRPRRFRSRA